MTLHRDHESPRQFSIYSANYKIQYHHRRIVYMGMTDTARVPSNHMGTCTLRQEGQKHSGRQNRHVGGFLAEASTRSRPGQRVWKLSCFCSISVKRTNNVAWPRSANNVCNVGSRPGYWTGKSSSGWSSSYLVSIPPHAGTSSHAPGHGVSG